MRLLSTVFKASLISDLTKIMLKTLEQYFNSPLLELTENKLKSKVIDNLNLLIIIAMNKLFGISVHERALKITEELWFWKRLNTFDDVIKCFLFEIDIEFNNQCSKYYNDNIIYNFEKSIFNAKKEIKEKIDFSSCLSIGITSSCNFKPLENKVLIESELNELKLKSEYIKNLKKFLIDI